MNTIIRNTSGIVLVPLKTQLLQKRKIYINGEINEETMINFTQSMQILTEQDDQAAVDVFIDSAGGEIRSGLVMYDIITTSKFEINLYVLGKAMSMAAVLLACGAKGHRFVMRNSEVMIHEPLVSSRVGGSTSSMKSIAQSLQESKDIIDNILAKHTGHTLEEVREATSFDHYYKAEEAIAWGLADEIVGFERIGG